MTTVVVVVLSFSAAVTVTPAPSSSVQQHVVHSIVVRIVHVLQTVVIGQDEMILVAFVFIINIRRAFVFLTLLF